MQNKKLFLFSLFLLLLAIGNPAYAIKKCKDADGKWHYGDVAVSECENSKVTTLNDRGVITGELEAPKSAEEIRDEEEAAALKAAEIAQRAALLEEKRRVMSIYETEADIDRQRDNQLDSVEGNIKVHQAYLSSMDKRIERFTQKQREAKSAKNKESYTKQIAAAKVRIKESRLELTELEAQKADIIRRFEKEKEMYIALKSAE